MKQLDFNNSRAFDNRDHGIGFAANNGAVVFNVGSAVLDAVSGLAPTARMRERYSTQCRRHLRRRLAISCHGRTNLKREDFHGGGGCVIDC